MAKDKHTTRKTGWAHTKWYPMKRHPAYYKREGKDDIKYVTFTHSAEVKFENGDHEKTERLNVNIDRKPKKNDGYSHIVPRVYHGKRSALGKETNEYRLDKSDYSKVESVFKSGKVYYVSRTSNSKKKKP